MSYDFAKAHGTYTELVNEQSEWMAEWRQISEYLLPGRGIYSQTSRPAKRRLTSPKVINNVAEDALYVLTSGMHGGLTSPSREWFRLEWTDARLEKVEPLKMWLQECQKRLHSGLQRSNFYSIINSFYIEYAGFGTGSTYVGHDTYDDDIPFRFELMTSGEYCVTFGPDGKPNQYFRVIFCSPRTLVERFGAKAPKEHRDQVRDAKEGVDSVDLTLLECVTKETYQKMPFTRRIFLLQGPPGTRNTLAEPIDIGGFDEFPYPVARWGTIGSDTYGIGPGSRALPDIKRLQEMEKAFLMATHKAINPPLNAPARMRGKLNTLPGGYNYYANPNETVNEIYQVRFDYQGVGSAVERVEQRLQRTFFNDIFLTAARDPNATPYKATEVNAREQEKMLRLGPVIERLQHEFLQPLIERCFNIMLRKDLMPELDPALAEMAGEYKISLISPLATAQRSVALQGINSFLAFIGQAAQFDQSILDNVDVDEAAREYADITGVRLGILRPMDKIKQIRDQRQQQMAQQQAKEEQAAVAQIGSQVSADRAMAQKTQAEAGLTQIESQKAAMELGMA